jgi:hypothetical protein
MDSEDAGVLKLYEPSPRNPTPCLYVAPVANMVGRDPLFPLYLAGNSTPTIPHKLSKHKGSGFPIMMGCAASDTAAADGRRGNNVHEVNQWLWQFGRGRPRCLGGLTVEKTVTALKKDNPFPKPIENDALNSDLPHRFGLAFQL